MSTVGSSRIDPRGRSILIGVALLGLGLGALFSALVIGLEPGDPVTVRGVVSLVGAAALTAGVFVGCQVLDWALSGGRAMVVLVERAVRRGELPPDADPREWSPALQRLLRRLARRWWSGSVLAVIFAILAVSQIVEGKALAQILLSLVIVVLTAVEAAVTLVQRARYLDPVRRWSARMETAIVREELATAST